MKLYYSAGSCSTSCHITLEESGLPYTAIEVDFDRPTDPNTLLVNQLNSLGTLPILITGDGKQLDQNLAIHIYIADLAPKKNLLPPFGTFDRIEALNTLSFVASDLHKSIGALFSLPSISSEPSVQAPVRKFMLDRAHQCLRYIDTQLAEKDYLMGKFFTVLDAYAFVVIGWTKWLEIPLASYSQLQNYLTRISVRPAVAKVLQAEGLNLE